MKMNLKIQEIKEISERIWTKRKERKQVVEILTYKNKRNGKWRDWRTKWY